MKDKPKPNLDGFSRNTTVKKTYMSKSRARIKRISRKLLYLYDEGSFEFSKIAIAIPKR